MYIYIFIFIYFLYIIQEFIINFVPNIIYNMQQLYANFVSYIKFKIKNV